MKNLNYFGFFIKILTRILIWKSNILSDFSQRMQDSKKYPMIFKIILHREPIYGYFYSTRLKSPG